MYFVLIVTVFSFVQCLLLAFKFISQKKRKLTTILISTLLVIISFDLLNGLLFFTHEIFNYPHFLRIQTSLFFLYGPLLYLIFRSYSEEKASIRKSDYLHLIPMILVTIYFFPLYFSSAELKIEYLKTMYQSVHSDSITIGFIRRIHLFFYIVEAFITIKNVPNRRPLLIVLLLFFLLWFIGFYRYIFDFELMRATIDTVILGFSVAYLSFIHTKEFSLEQHVKYKGRALNDEELKTVYQAVQTYLIEQNGFQNPLLTVKSLSNELKLSGYKISQAINKKTGKHFF